MRATRRDVLRGLGVAAAGLALPTIISRRGFAADEIPVGSLLDASGPINIYGLPMIDATRFAIEDINANGGVLGKKLKLIEFDTQSNNQLYTQAASKMILEDEVAVLMGGITSASREAVRPVIDKNEQLYFYNEQYEGGVCDKFVFCTGITPSQQLSVLVDWTLKEYGKKVYTIAADYNYGHISADWVKVFLKRDGGELVGEEFIPLDVNNFDSIIQHIEKAKPSAVLSLLVGGNHIAFYRQFAAAGLNKKIPTVSATFGLGNEQVVLQPEEAEGLAVIYPYFQELDNPVNKEWVKRWHAKFGDNYTYITDSSNSAWNGWHLWALGANKAGSLDRAKVTEALESGITFESPGGTIKLDPQSHHVVHTVHLAKVNSKHGFDIIKTFPNLEPTDTMQVCDLIKQPDQHTQFTPKF
jgi:branched-chain amino acid transport system substrate-binding protein